MSGGQQQRLALAIAISTDPEIILLDEPTAALDPGARRTVWRMIAAMKEQGRTVVLTTHSMEEAEALCGRVAIMDRGRVVACGEPGNLIADLNVTPVLKAAIDLPLEEVKPLAGARTARYAGDHLEIETAEPLATLNALSELARQHGRIIRSIAIRQPNLEDVYLKLTGQAFSS
jgi:ABC-2 type transport system ATP-binding protein